jgi:hypothetical protein
MNSKFTRGNYALVWIILVYKIVIRPLNVEIHLNYI